ncbi:hypothetical protein BLOT_002776 [Blomia tropicalis]|nr:hypothetical protein BLOT_002776 [Blomia tropicalis]
MTDIKRRYDVFDFELLLCVSKVGQCHIDPAMIFLFMRVDYQLYRNFRIFRSPNLAISSDSKVVPNIKSYLKLPFPPNLLLTSSICTTHFDITNIDGCALCEDESFFVRVDDETQQSNLHYIQQYQKGRKHSTGF